MPFEQREVLRVRFPEDIGEIAHQRNRAHDEIDRDVDEHAELNDSRHAHLMRLHDDRARQHRRERIAQPRHRTDQRIPTEPDAGAGHAEGVVEGTEVTGTEVTEITVTEISELTGTEITGTEVTEITGTHRETEQRRKSPYKQDVPGYEQPSTGTRTRRF